MPMLSIIIATFNAGKTLATCIESILSQNFKSYEILIVDGRSTDSTVSIIEKYQTQIAYWHSKSDAGIYDAWNQGLIQANGEYICFIGADDAFSDDNALTRIFDKVGQHKYDLISSKGLLLGPRKNHVTGNPWDYKKLGRRITICHPGLMHNRNLFARYGEFDTEYRIAGDYEFLLRLPPETTSLHVAAITVLVGDGGISRAQYMDTLREKRTAQENCPRIGKLRAQFNYYDKLWRIPVAKILNIPC